MNSVLMMGYAGAEERSLMEKVRRLVTARVSESNNGRYLCAISVLVVLNQRVDREDASYAFCVGEERCLTMTGFLRDAG